jgi:hypothetical protein
MKIKKSDWIILLINLIYTIIFTILFIKRQNNEFLLYIGVLVILIIFVSYLHLKKRFSIEVLLGLTIWGILHMFGGYFIINGGVLYGYWIFPFLRYDHAVHFFGFGITVLLAYDILKDNIKRLNKFSVAFFLILIGMGFGAINEMVEFLAVSIMPETGVGGYENTMWDIVFNSIGAIAAVVYLKVRGKLR